MLVVRVGPRSFHGFNQKPSSKWDDRLVQLWEDVEETSRVLKRLGYITYQDKEGYCDSTTLDYQVDYFANRANNGGSSASASASSLPPYNANDANPKTSGGSAGMESFVCVWGTRVNALEFGGATWGKW